MASVNTTMTRAFDLIFAPSASSPWLGMVLISVLTGVVLLVVFRYTSNQRGIRAAKDSIIASLLEVLLYRDELRVVLRAQARLFKDNLRYLGYALVPLCFMIVPVAFLLVQTDLRYGHRPLHPGEQAIVAVHLPSGEAQFDRVTLSAPAGIAVETPPLRIPALAEVDWRVRAVEPGVYHLRFTVGEKKFAKRVIVGDYGVPVSPKRVDGGIWAQFSTPGEPPLPPDVPVSSVEVSYPTGSLRLFRWNLHWIWPWLILSMAFGYALKGPLRVQV